MSGKRLWFVAGLVLLLAACSGGTPPQDLALSGVSPDRPTVVQGQSVTLTLTFTSQNGFQGQVSLSVTEGGQTPSWLTLSPTSKTLNVPKGGQVQETLQLRVAGDAPTGARSLKLRATYGDRTAERDLTLTVSPPPDFTLSLSPNALTVQQGNSGTTTLTLTPQNGFTGTVGLSLVAGQDGVPQGLSLSPQSLQVTGSSPVSQALTLTASAGTPAGTYRIKVRGTGQNITRDVDLTVTVSPPPDFTLSLSPNALTVQQGNSGTTTLTLTPQNGFTGTVGLSLVAGQDGVPQGLSLSPQSLQVTGSSPVSQALTLTASAGTPAGTYRIKVRGTGQNITRDVDLTVTVSPPPDFTLSLSPWPRRRGPMAADRTHRPHRHPGGHSLGLPSNSS